MIANAWDVVAVVWKMQLELNEIPEQIPKNQLVFAEYFRSSDEVEPWHSYWYIVEGLSTLKGGNSVVLIEIGAINPPA